MDFISFLRDVSERLTRKEFVDLTWSVMRGNSEHISENLIEDYNKHLPLFLPEFFESLLDKVVKSDYSLEELDEELKIYLLVLLYYCISTSTEIINLPCNIYASCVYLHLLYQPQGDDFFLNSLFEKVLNILTLCTEATINQETLLIFLNKLHKFLAINKLSSNNLEAALGILTKIVFLKTSRTHADFDNDSNNISVDYEAYLTLKDVVKNETVQSKLAVAITYLFNGLRKTNIHSIPNVLKAIQTNYRNLLRTLQPKFQQDDYKSFLNAFIHVWRHPDIYYFEEAALIMNDLKEEHYRILIDTLNKMIMSNMVHKNLFKLVYAIMCNPPKFSNTDKVKTTNQIFTHNVMVNCLHKNSEIANAAIETFSEILTSQRELIVGPAKEVINSKREGNFSVPTLLKGFQSLINRKWVNKARSKHLFAIIVSIILYSDVDYSSIFTEVLDQVSEGASPFDLKSFIPLLSETFLRQHDRNKDSARCVLKIMVKMALHPMATSSDFVKYIYKGMTGPTSCRGGRRLKSEYFLQYIITDDFNFKVFFEKCFSLGIIREDDISKHMNNVENISSYNWRFICAIIDRSTYKNLTPIANYVNNNFETLNNNPDLRYLFYVYKHIFKKNPTTYDHERVRCNDIVMSFIKYHLLKFNFPYLAVPNAFMLFKCFGAYTNIRQEFDIIKQEYDRALTTALENKTQYLPLLYYSQLVVFSKTLPSEENLTTLTRYLESISTNHNNNCDPAIEIACLFLYTNICLVKNSLADNGIRFLVSTLKHSKTVSSRIVRLAVINMLFDLSNMVTHNFDDFIKLMFNEIVHGEMIFKITTVVKVDRLIRDNYLKLEPEQYLKFILLLGDKGYDLEDYMESLLSESFFINNGNIIAKYFAPLIVHINGYSKHPLYMLSKEDTKDLQSMSIRVLDRQKLYETLLNVLPIKLRLNVVRDIATHILLKMMTGKLKQDGMGYWKMIKDSISIYKLCTSDKDRGSNAEYYKKTCTLINKHIVKETRLERAGEHYKEILDPTVILLKLLFFENTGSNVQRQIQNLVFDAVMCWTDFVIADLVHIVHVDRNKELRQLYSKVENFYKENKNSLTLTEDSFDAERVLGEVGTSASVPNELFSLSGTSTSHIE